MFNGFELNEITKYLNNYDFYNFRLVCKYFYNKTYNERIIRKCKTHIMAIKIQRFYKNMHINIRSKIDSSICSYFGQRIVFSINRCGDLLTNQYLSVQLPQIEFGKPYESLGRPIYKSYDEEEDDTKMYIDKLSNINE